MMKNKPFNSGQKIVRIGPSNEYVTNGHIYEVDDCFMCSCGGWHVTLKNFPIYKQGFNCSYCGGHIKHTSFRGGDAKNFAPIKEEKELIKYVAVSETLRESSILIAAIETN